MHIFTGMKKLLTMHIKRAFKRIMVFIDGSYDRENACIDPEEKHLKFEKISTIAVFVLIYACLFYIFRPNLLFSPTMTAGGDTGTHHFGIKFLIEELLPKMRLTGFTLDWYAGMPMLSFYFPFPYLLVALLSNLIHYNIAFNIITVLGIFSLPAAVFYFIKSMHFKFPYPLLASVFSLVFLFMNSYSIYGANMLSTLAGEFGYSISFSLVFLFLATFRKALFRQRLDWLFIGNCLLLAAIALSHVLTTICLLVMLLGYGFYRLKRRPLLYSSLTLLTGFFLTAFWSIPFAFYLTFTPNMGWVHITSPRPLAVNELFISLVLCVSGAGIYGYYLKKKKDKRHIMLLWSLVIFVLIFFIPTGGRVWNARLLPFYYIIVNIWAAYFLYFLYYGIVHILKRKHNKKIKWLTVFYVPAVLIIALSIILPLGPTAAPWARWNYSGYENKEGWPVFTQIIDYIKDLEQGRFMVEQDKEKVQKTGTSRTFELIPYFTDHAVMEGLLVEGSFSAPFHFMNQAELSLKPSNAIPALKKPSRNIAMGITHLQMFHIRYMIASSEEVVNELEQDPRAFLLSVFDDFHIFEIEKKGGYIEIPEYMPLRVQTDDWYATIGEWYKNEDALKIPIIWDRSDGDLNEYTLISEEEASDPSSKKLDIDGNILLKEFEHERISFETDAIGVPHIVKVSYFPNWKAKGALGPFAVSPSFMLVIPTQKDVTLYYGKTGINIFSDLLTLAGTLFLLGLLVFAIIKKVKEKKDKKKTDKKSS
jgi:hypothetical protein